MNVSSPNSSAVQSTQKPTQLQKTEQNREQTQRQEQAKPAQPAPPKPVVNTQGQTTGRVLNVTA